MKLLIIIGAGPGIGYSVARKFGTEGFKIALIARSEQKLKQLVDQLKSEGIAAIHAVGDVATEQSLKNALHQIYTQEGHASVILYNAASASSQDILEQHWENITSDSDVTVGGYFNLMKTVLPFCMKNNYGKLFVTGGGLALDGHPQLTSLSVGKAALRNLVQAFQKRIKDTDIHLAQLTICGFLNPSDKKYNGEAIAERYWQLYNQKPGEFENEIIY